MLEGEDCCAIATIVQLIAPIMNQTIGYSDEQKPTTVHTMYSALANFSMVKPCSVIALRVFSYI